MTCHRITLPGGGFAIVCERGRRSKTKPCSVPGCGRPSSYQCDHPVDLFGATCDAHLCRIHRTPIGPEKDLCPTHANP